MSAAKHKQSVATFCEQLRGVLIENEASADRLILAVSGGRDSVALLDAVVNSRGGDTSLLTVAHVDHGLRPDSAEEARFVESLAGKYGCEFVGERLGELPEKHNVEAWAREQRYRLLETWRELFKAQWILTAHHLDDQAETVLMRLIAGRFATSARGIAARDDRRHLLRPLIGVSREAIDAYITNNNLRYVEDSSNADLSRTRNRIRHCVIPQLTQDLNPALSDALALFASRSAEDEAYLETIAQTEWFRLAGPLTAAFIAELVPALRWRVLREAVIRVAGNSSIEIGFAALKRLEQHLLTGRGEIHLGAGLRGAILASGELSLWLHQGEQEPEIVAPPIALKIPGTICRNYPDGSSALITAELVDRDSCNDTEFQSFFSKRSPQGATMVFDASKISGQALVRERVPGDVIRVWSRGRRKLKKLFQEQEVMLTERDRVPIVELGGEIIWVPGLARSDIAPITQGTRQILVLKYQPNVPSSNG